MGVGVRRHRALGPRLLDVAEQGLDQTRHQQALEQGLVGLLQQLQQGRLAGQLGQLIPAVLLRWRAASAASRPRGGHWPARPAPAPR
jgi:hypothetical protein